MLLRRAFVVLAFHVLALGSVLEDDNARDRAVEALRGKTLRVAFTTIENPYIFKDESGAWTGVLKDFLDELRREVGFLVTYVPVSNESYEILGSSNTACARDVAQGWTDLCVGNSWVTTQRLGYANVLPTLWFETLQLGVKVTTGTKSFWYVLVQAFAPFEFSVWFCIVGVIIVYAFFIWYFEHAENDADYPDKHFVMSGATSLYHGFFGFVWSDPPTQPVTTEGRILALGFGFFTLIMMSSYTASLASVLVSTNSGPEFEDLQDALDQDAKVCMWLSVLSRAEKLYPGLPALAVNMGGSYKDGYDNLNNGACQVILADAIFHAKAQERSERDCDKVLVGGPIVDINCAWPAAEWVVSPLSYFITDMMAKGVLDDLRRVYSPRVLCENTDSVEAGGLTVGNVSGVIFIIGGFLMIAAFVHSCKGSLRYARRSGALERFSSRKTQPPPAIVVEGTEVAPAVAPAVAPSTRASTPVEAAAGDPLAELERNSRGSGDDAPTTARSNEVLGSARSTNDALASGRSTASMSQEFFARRSTAASMQTAFAMAKRATRRFGTNTSKPSVDPNDPGFAVVHAYRSEKQLSELPFVKALLIMADVQAKANNNMVRTLRQLQRTGEGESPRRVPVIQEEI